MELWSRRLESNQRPAVYETAALPTELRRRWRTEKTRWEQNDRMIASRLRRVNRRLSDRYFRCESGMAADFDAVEGGTHIGCCAS